MPFDWNEHKRTFGLGDNKFINNNKNNKKNNLKNNHKNIRYIHNPIKNYTLWDYIRYTHAISEITNNN